MALLYYLNYINLLIISLAALLGIYRFRMLDRAARMVILLTALVLTTECLGRYAAHAIHDNRIIYDIYSILEFILLAMYFNELITWFRPKRIGPLMAAMVSAAGTYELCTGKAHQLKPVFIQLQQLLIIAMCLLAFLQFLRNKAVIVLPRNIHFWITTAFFISGTATFLSWNVYEYFAAGFPDGATWINYFLLLVNMATYLLVSFIFFRLPKTNKVHE
jgi:hypothetical protein